MAVPNEVAYAVSYVGVVFVTLWSPRRRVTMIATVVATLLAVGGAFLDPNAAPTSQTIANRAVALGAIWLTALVVLQHKRADAARRSVQERNAALLENMEAAFIGMDAEGRITDWNPQADHLFGWSRQEALGRPLVETIIPPELRAAHMQGLGRFLDTGKGAVLRKPMEMQGLRRDGRLFPVELLIGAHQQPSGEYWFYAFLQDITARKQAERKLRAKQRAIERLAERLMSSQEDERRRVARELHDDISQEMAVWSMKLARAEESLPPEFREPLRPLQEGAVELANKVHAISHSLHPAILEQLGLVDGIRHECERFTEHQGIEVDFRSDELPTRVPIEVALPVYRILQEAFRNIAKHAGAKHVKVRLGCKDEQVCLLIEDDGKGFEGERRDSDGHLGLLSMQERAHFMGGRLVIESAPAQGTRVELHAPLKTECPGSPTLS